MLDEATVMKRSIESKIAKLGKDGPTGLIKVSWKEISKVLNLRYWRSWFAP